ncbi:Conserved hypothetical protein [Prochlorococcus marinus str. MIT 9303]|uniref:Uncharacterized protein n=1 Tax=Prochlorococcus marinus (strain MIT 9303) TaxID=59922 RepID=A2C8H0_PROM3|nr:Conserved hypothetical protein [Prochlorococcus marinus str. MIT 9303]
MASRSRISSLRRIKRAERSARFFLQFKVSKSQELANGVM